VRFIAFETLTTGVLARECAFNSRTSSFVHGFETRCAALFAIFQHSQLEAVHIVSNFWTSSEDALTVLISSYNWTRVLPLVEDENASNHPGASRGFCSSRISFAFTLATLPSFASKCSLSPANPHRPDRAPARLVPLLWRVLDARMSSRPSGFRNTTIRPIPCRSFWTGLSRADTCARLAASTSIGWSGRNWRHAPATRGASENVDEGNLGCLAPQCKTHLLR
jgi:hypothetical protein